MNRPPITVIREGAGPEVLLVHGGASPEATWSGLEDLKARWTLMFAYRRGFAPSPSPPRGRQDFEVDATDIGELLDSRPHLVGHSYGGVAAAIAALRRRSQVRSLTLLEPALFLPPDDPEVRWFQRIGEEFLTHGLETRTGDATRVPQDLRSACLRPRSASRRRSTRIRRPTEAIPPVGQLSDHQRSRG
jgi:pimeloyl-ACP methyl ester carboxylesterase